MARLVAIRSPAGNRSTERSHDLPVARFGFSSAPRAPVRGR
ncbi:MAG: hypothetical protein ACRDY7_15135 [Acidimicrobiia bacterium]